MFLRKANTSPLLARDRRLCCCLFTVVNFASRLAFERAEGFFPFYIGMYARRTRFSWCFAPFWLNTQAYRAKPLPDTGNLIYKTDPIAEAYCSWFCSKI